MKNMRLHIYVVLGVFVLGFILGSFLDLNLSQAIFSNKNNFGLFISAIGTIPGYGMLALIGGGFFALGLRRKDYHMVARVFMDIGCFVLLGLGTYFAGREFFGPNGFEEVAPEWVGYFIALPFMGGFCYLGYFLIKKSSREYLWLLLIILAVAIFLALVPGVTALKSIFHRPRFRSLGGVVEFYPWWKRCSDYESLMIQSGLDKEEFKSFPSGHAGAAMVFVLASAFLPMLDKKYARLQLPIFYTGVLWVILVAFARILVGAHFLSDVSMGSILTLIFLIAANEVIMHLKWFKEE